MLYTVGHLRVAGFRTGGPCKKIEHVVGSLGNHFPNPTSFLIAVDSALFFLGVNIKLSIQARWQPGHNPHWLDPKTYPT